MLTEQENFRLSGEPAGSSFTRRTAASLLLEVKPGRGLKLKRDAFTYLYFKQAHIRLDANPKNLAGLALEVMQGQRNNNIGSVKRKFLPLPLDSFSLVFYCVLNHDKDHVNSMFRLYCIVVWQSWKANQPCFIC